MNQQKPEYFLDAMGITQWRQSSVANTAVQMQTTALQKVAIDTSVQQPDAKQNTQDKSTQKYNIQQDDAQQGDTQKSSAINNMTKKHLDDSPTQHLAIQTTTQPAVTPPAAHCSGIATQADNQPDTTPFSCALYVIIDNQQGLCLVADVQTPDLPAEQRLLDSLFGRLGGCGNYIYQGIFHWPISDEYADVESARQALCGLLSNWSTHNYLLVLGSVASLLLVPHEDYEAGAVCKWQEAQLLMSYDAHALLMNKQLRHDTWTHFQPVRAQSTT